MMKVYDPEETYQRIKDGTDTAFSLLTQFHNPNWNLKMTTDYIVDVFNDEMEGVTLFLWMISIARKEIELDLLERRVLAQISGLIPEYQNGDYDRDLQDVNKEMVAEDVAFILDHVELRPVELVPDEEYSQLDDEYADDPVYQRA